MFCPDTETKKCIKSDCIAYKSDYKPYLWKCENCEEKIYLGGDCGCGDRRPIPIKRFHYCKKYNVEIKEYL